MISVFWKSRRQTLVSLSTAECELIAACEGVVLAQSVQALAEELLGETLGLVLRVDNVAAIILAEGGGSQRTRHLRVRANFLKEMIENNSLQVRHCPGELQLADALTKALPAPRLEHLNRLLGISVPSLDAPSVQAIAATSRTFGNLEVASEGQGLILVILLMMQLQPAASQEDEERDPIDIDLYIVAVMMACSVLFVWELGKHCLRQCTRDTEAQVASLRPTEEESRRSRRQETIRRALEREAGEGLRPRRGSQGTHDVTKTYQLPPREVPQLPLRYTSTLRHHQCRRPVHRKRLPLPGNHDSINQLGLWFVLLLLRFPSLRVKLKEFREGS